jgi:hypothetical protein
MMVSISEAELTALRRDAARFRAEQDRAWAGWPEYSIVTHSNEGRQLNKDVFMAWRAAAIDAKVVDQETILT